MSTEARREYYKNINTEKSEDYVNDYLANVVKIVNANSPAPLMPADM